MHRIIKTIIKMVLSLLPTMCILAFVISSGALAISLNPDVKWNEYTDINYGYNSYYFNTLWSSLDGFSYATTHGNYLQMLSLEKLGEHDESWKIPIRKGLYKGIGLVSGGIFLLTIAITVHSFTKQKLFVVILHVITCGSGIAGGYFTLHSTGQYKDGIVGALLKTTVDNLYHEDKEQMKLGYNLAVYSAILSLVGSGFILVYIGLYIPFGEGKWVWEKKTTVEPDQVNNTTNSILEKIPNGNGLQEKKKKPEVITVQEVNQ